MKELRPDFPKLLENNDGRGSRSALLAKLALACGRLHSNEKEMAKVPWLFCVSMSMQLSVFVCGDSGWEVFYWLKSTLVACLVPLRGRQLP